VTNDPKVTAYCGVYLWAQAARAAGTVDPPAVREAMRTQTFQGPGGEVRIDAATLHTWKPFRLGRIVADGQFKVVWSNDRLIAPEPFPPSRTPLEWEKFLDDLKRGWGGRWEKPPASRAFPD
jgi:urea transport system substrate-binding protein